MTDILHSNILLKHRSCYIGLCRRSHFLDLKTPGSLEDNKNLWTNLAYLKSTDQIKFVLCSRADYEWACQKIKEHALEQKAQLLFSPSWNQLNPTDLANWIVEDRLPVRFQLQLHKILWNDSPGH